MSALVVKSASGMPATIGRYRVVGRLGKGAMGIVYSGRDDQLERDVALKVMMADLESDPETRARFYREAQITGKLLHRNIITVFDLGEEDGRLYLVMELLKGRTLAEFLKEPEAETLEQKLDLMIQTCEGLSIAHAKGVVHRDIKPSNLFVQSDGALKILDFGIARLASSNMTASGLIMGTPDYMSPEQAQGKDVDARSDIFSAAGVFYFMLTGRRPFEAAELPTVLQKVVREDPLPIRAHEAPPALAQVIAKGLQKDPGQRYQRVADLAADLVRFKRHFDTETRRLVASAKECFDRIAQLLATDRELRVVLGAEVPDSLVHLHHSLGERYPFFAPEPAEEGAPVVPLKRSRVSTILDDLNSVLTPLSAGVDALQDAAAAVEAGEAALGRGDARAALTHFEGAGGFLTDELPRLAAGASAAREAIAVSQELADRVRALIAEARAAEGRGSWAAVVELCAQALEIEPRRPEVLALMAKAQAAAESEKQVRVRQVQRLMTQADKAIEQAHFADADHLLDEAQGFRINDEAVRVARARLNDARMAASAADARTRRAARELAAARAMFDAADRQGAIAKLETLAAEDPNAPGVATEIRDMRAEIERLVADEQRRVEASARAQEAAAYWEAGEVSKALQSADAALSLDRGQQGALRVQSLAKTRLREQAEAAARSAQAEARVAKARVLLASGRFEKAEREAQEALDLEPGRADAALVVADARRLEAEAEAERVRQDAVEHRERAVDKILKGAKKDLRAGNYDRAAWAAENALLIRPGHHQAQEILAEARSSLLASQRRPVDPDDTVQLSRDGHAALDPAATVVMTPNAAVPAGNSIADWASGLRRRLLPSRGRTTPVESRGGGPVRTR